MKIALVACRYTSEAHIRTFLENFVKDQDTVLMTENALLYKIVGGYRREMQRKFEIVKVRASATLMDIKKNGQRTAIRNRNDLLLKQADVVKVFVFNGTDTARKIGERARELGKRVDITKELHS